MERKLGDAVKAAGVGALKDMLIEPVPSPCRVGLHEEADDFLTLIRYALPYNTKAGDEWRKHLPLVLLRVREKTSTRVPEPYPPAVLDTRTAFPELKSGSTMICRSLCRR